MLRSISRHGGVSVNFKSQNSMDFKENKPIYQQIITLVAERIIRGEWGEGERIPSVRELGMELGVNPNTCMRAYEQLSENGVIALARGIGYSVCIGGRECVMQMNREDFMKNILPEIFAKMKLLGIGPEQLMKLYQESRQNE